MLEAAEMTALVELLEKFMDPHFETLETKMDSLSTKMTEEHKENREKFQELFTSRNELKSSLVQLRTEFQTRLKMTTIIISVVFSLISIFLACLRLGMF